MGYYSTMSGELTISPPLTWGQFKDSEFREGSEASRGTYPCVKFRVEQETIESDTGRTEVITAVAVEPESGESRKLYYLEEEVQRLVDAYPGHTFTGEFLIEGEEALDVWKLVVDDQRKVRQVHPRIVWPDGSEMRGRHNQ